jgi:predicted nucleic acid-binding protein
VKAVFADTFYWTALSLPGDAAYARAEQVTDDIVTTEEVLTEYVNFFCASPEYLRREVVSNVEAILHDPAVRVLPQRHESFAAGFELYRARPDKGYSLTDCISMQAMRSEGITDVLTNDVHFEQGGFCAVLREPRQAG